MTPKLPAIGSYVRAVQIFGLSGVANGESCLGSLGKVVSHHPGDELGDIVCEFEGCSLRLHVYEWELDAPAQPAPEPETAESILAESIANMGSDKFRETADAYLAEGEMTAASAVLEAGQDPAIQYLRKRLHGVEQNIELFGAAISEQTKNLNNAKTDETILLDLIAARMDQLKGQSI